MAHMNEPITPDEQEFAANCVAPGSRPSLPLIPEFVDEDWDEEEQ